jgi:hypothetical protein
MTLYLASPAAVDPDADTGADTGAEDSGRWLALARDAYDTSTDYFDASVRGRVEKALAHFKNRHAPGSKYHSEAYKYRAKGFRPKTRSTVRRAEAAAAVAYFSTQEAVHVSAEDNRDDRQRAGAALTGALLNYRLENNTPWFLTLVGAYQDAINTGVCISHQYWDYREAVDYKPITDPVTGMPLTDPLTGDPLTYSQVQVLSDQPAIDLVPIENFRFSPAADWRNPAERSPYLIELIPMFIGDVLERMKLPGQDGTAWFPMDEAEIRGYSAMGEHDSVRTARAEKGQQPTTAQHEHGAFDIVWIHRNIIRRDGIDWFFYTVGTEALLSDPAPLRDVYAHLEPGERPYVIGTAMVESHQAMPPGLTSLMHSLQQEANDISNQRRDNVALVLNKRYFARKGAQIDWAALKRNVPGGIVQMTDIASDLRSEESRDVTGSAYQEQDRVNVDFDELGGTFSPGTIASNRALNETVGGMSLLQSDSNVMGEYMLRIFNETWVEPVLRQMVKLLQRYDDDPKLLAILGADALEGGMEANRELIQGPMAVRVNVGFGATKPEQRLQKLDVGLSLALKYAPQLAGAMDAKEVLKEVFGAIGYKGADRFFPQQQGEDPRMAQMQQQIAQLEQALKSRQGESQARAQASLQAAQIKAQADAQALDKELAFKRWQAEQELALDTAKLQADKQEQMDSHKVDLSKLAIQEQAKRRQFEDEARLKARLGPQGNYGLDGPR